MTKRRAAVCLTLVIVLVLGIGLWHSGQAYAQTGATVIPKSFGTCKGSTILRDGNSALIFEDSTGHIRLVRTRDGVFVQEFARQ